MNIEKLLRAAQNGSVSLNATTRRAENMRKKAACDKFLRENPKLSEEQIVRVYHARFASGNLNACEYALERIK